MELLPELRQRGVIAQVTRVARLSLEMHLRCAILRWFS